MQCQAKLPNGRTCGDYVFPCKKCGAQGCANRECKNQRFDPTNGRCFSCGGHR